MYVSSELYRICEAHSTGEFCNKGVLYDAFIEAGYPNIAKRHFGEDVERCVDNKECSAVLAVLQKVNPYSGVIPTLEEEEHFCGVYLLMTEEKRRKKNV